MSVNIADELARLGADNAALRAARQADQNKTVDAERTLASTSTPTASDEPAGAGHRCHHTRARADGQVR